MATIKEIASACGVSEQAIRKWCSKHGVSRVAGQWKPSETDIEAMARHYGADVSLISSSFATNERGPKPGAKPSETAVDALARQLEVLREQLEVKDAQIAALSSALTAAQETAREAQETAKAAQALHAADKARMLAIEERAASKSRWQRIKEAWTGESSEPR